jgi:hypothetical protein
MIMEIAYPEIGVCGLYCGLCPSYHRKSISRCGGCKSESGRMRNGCPFITCAVKRKGIEFCWQCADQDTCERWQKHRKRGQSRDSFVCYQRLEDNIAFVAESGFEAFAAAQEDRKRMLTMMVEEFNDGHSKSFYCIAATVMETPEIECAINEARHTGSGKDAKSRAVILRSILDEIGREKGYFLKLRK